MAVTFFMVAVTFFTVIHPLVRSAPLFSAHGRRLPWTDPVETALDLCELSLGPQANRLLSSLRPEVRLS